jgi:hypothetical protein
MFHFLLELAARPVSLGNLRNGEDELAYLYKSVTTKTLSRDISFLKQHELVIQDGDKLSANLDIMTIFTPPSQMRRPRMG